MDLPVRSIDICMMNENKNIYSRISDNDTGAAGIFYGKLCLAILTGDATFEKQSVSVIYNPSISRRYVPIALER
jgi:hypothetical protein